jgi:TrmH family RNA methyltransferase
VLISLNQKNPHTQMALISSRSNPNVKSARALRQRKARQETNLFLVEGIRHVGEAVSADAGIESIFYAPDLLRSDYAFSLIEGLSDKGVSCLATTAEVFQSIAEKENPQGIIAIVRKPGTQLDDLAPQIFPWGVAIINPQDPGNIGSILRTIDAVGASGLLLLDNSVDPTHPSAVRASMGTIFWHPVVRTSFTNFKEWTQRHNYHVYATSARAKFNYRNIKVYKTPRILLMGSERQGLTQEQLQISENQIRLPMSGRTTSLNLSVATGIMLYAMLERDKK